MEQDNINLILNYLTERLQYSIISQKNIKSNLPPMLKKTVEDAYFLRDKLEYVKSEDNLSVSVRCTEWDDWSDWAADYTDIYP